MQLSARIIITFSWISFAQALNISQWNFNILRPQKSIDGAVSKYYETKTFMMSVGVYMEYSKYYQNVVSDYLTEALTHSKFMKYEIFMKSKNSHERVTKVSYHNLWYVDSYKGFRSLLVAVKNDYNENMGEYFIVMDVAKPLKRDQEVKSILETSFQLNIVDVVVAVYVRNGTFKLYSFDVFHPHHCRQVVVEQVNLFRNGQFQNKELFPYKFRNFHNCPVTMYIRNSSLFYRFNLTKDGTEIDHIEGVEANMIQIMAKKLNFKLRMYYNAGDSGGRVYENGTSVGTFRFLNENKVDVLLGYYHYPVRSRFFAESTTYAFMPLVMVISEHNRHEFVGIWLIKPFGPITWLVLGLQSLLVVVIVQLAHYYLSRSVTWIDIVGLALGNSRPLRIKSYVIKFSFFVCIFGTMLLCATFQGRLYNAFNSGSVFKINDIEQLIKANYTFLLKSNFDSDLIQSLHIPLKQIQLLDVVEDYFIYDIMRSYPTNVATLTNYWDFQMYVESKKCYSEFDILSTIVVLNQICAYMKDHSYLIQPINRLIHSLNVAGILYKWMHDLSNFDKNNNIELYMKHKMSTKPVPLTLIKLRVVFMGLLYNCAGDGVETQTAHQHRLHCFTVLASVAEITSRSHQLKTRAR
ncbi:uncharacterized protein LOC111679553 [Lucilia cuprina]|uniref:uncharacterized protein LOC111679553 n=1 Tax=Lucilia cuprina TaxID=7375 RepID=UPI001F063B9D|nr:uncharacterized protein LOC111679553 [Lucilia cuprina]